MDKILTVSVAAYNDQKYIKRLLDSIIRMDTNLLENIGILVNDDGGTDNTRKIVEEYENKFPNIIKFIHKANGGYGSVVNNNLEILYKFDNEIKKRNREIFCDMSNYSKKVKMLRKFKYNYFIYLIMHFCCNKKIRR